MDCELLASLLSLSLSLSSIQTLAWTKRVLAVRRDRDGGRHGGWEQKGREQPHLGEAAGSSLALGSGAGAALVLRRAARGNAA